MRLVSLACLLSGLVLAGTAAATDNPGDKLTEVLVSSSKRFVAMDEITTPIFGESRIEGALSVRIVLETADPSVANAMRPLVPQLRAAAVTTTLEFARLNASGYAPVEAPLLSGALNRALKAVDPRVARVLIVRVGASAA